MRKQIWFGTEEKMRWIRCPQIDADVSAVPWSEDGVFLNGGGWARSSSVAHATTGYNWAVLDHEEWSAIRAIFGGAYGPGPYYFTDPGAGRTNLMPQYISAPRHMTETGNPSFGGAPTLVTTPANDQDYPTQGATWSEVPQPSNTFAFMVPPGFTLHVGAKGSATGTAQLRGNATNIPLLPVATPQRFSQQFAGGANGTRVDIGLGGTGSITLYGVMAQLTPTGEAPSTGPYLHGVGHSGMALSGAPEFIENNAATGRYSAYVQLKEVGAWESR